jgi:hypothetical protein
MADIYIDVTNGNDTTGAGTSGNPYATLSKAFTLVAAGDTIKIANTGVQSFASLAFPAIATTTDAWLVIEGWNNGGAQVIDNPQGNFTDVGVIEGRLTGTLANVKFKKIKFQNVSIGTNLLIPSNTAHVFEYCDFNAITITSGGVLSLGANSTTRFCSFRNLTLGTGTAVLFSGAVARVLNCYFYNVARSIATQTQNSSLILGCVFDKIGVAGIIVGGADYTFIINNTFIGDTGLSGIRGIRFDSASMEGTVIYNNHFQDFSNGSSSAIASNGVSWPTTKGTFDIVGNSSFYNNATNPTYGTNFAAACMTDLTGSDIIETAEPLVDKAAFNYAKRETALSYGRSGIPFGLNYSETKTNQTTGAINTEVTETSYAGV